MNYELAKKLKNAGFPITSWNDNSEAGEWSDGTYEPTLSELIEACRLSVFFDLKKVSDGWIATDNYKVGKGKTPEEAVAWLWLITNTLPGDTISCTDCRKLLVNCTCEDDAIQNLAEEKHNEQITI